MMLALVFNIYWQVPNYGVNVTDYAAWFGVILATLSLAISVWLARRDRPALAVEVITTPHIDRETEVSGQKNVNLIIVNRGRRPIGIATIRLIRDSGVDHPVLNRHSNPVILNEGQSSERYPVADGHELTREQLMKSEVRVLDAYGENWRASVKPNQYKLMKRLKAKR